MSKLWHIQWNTAHNKTLYSAKKEGTSDIRYSISRNEGQYVKCNEPATKVQIHKAVGSHADRKSSKSQKLPGGIG